MKHPGAALTLGPVLFHWPASTKQDFYYRIADEAPIDTVYIGEVICAKRYPLFAPYLPQVIDRLQRGGKNVILSTLAPVTTDRDLSLIRETAQSHVAQIEANDMGAVALLAGRPFVVGPFVNSYNEDALRVLADLGAVNFVVSHEVDGSGMATLAAAARAANVDTEVQVFGRLPIALSSRCYHARYNGRTRDTCQYACESDPNGLDVATVTGQPVVTINGMQVLSHAVGCLIHELSFLRQSGISAFRLWPLDIDMVAVARLFRATLDEQLEPAAAELSLAELCSFAPFANGAFHKLAASIRVKDC